MIDKILIDEFGNKFKIIEEDGHCIKANRIIEVKPVDMSVFIDSGIDFVSKGNIEINYNYKKVESIISKNAYPRRRWYSTFDYSEDELTKLLTRIELGGFLISYGWINNKLSAFRIDNPKEGFEYPWKLD